MKVGIIGTGWGRTHCGTFRAAGCDIAALLGRNLEEVEQVASEEGVGLATTDPIDLEHCDILVVASPTPTHLEYLRRFRHKPILCEKPLSSGPLSDEELAFFDEHRIFVNYAFPFLETMRTLEAHLDGGRFGHVRRIFLQVGVALPAEKSASEWFHEVAVHPLSFVLHRFGRFHLQHVHSRKGPADLSVLFEQDDRQLDVTLYSLPHAGIRFDWMILGETAIARLGGGYQPDRDWWFDPLLIDESPVNEGEYSRMGSHRTEDIWYRANRRAVQQFCAIIRGQLSTDRALTRGSFDLGKAAEMERMLGPLLDSPNLQHSLSEHSR